MSSGQSLRNGNSVEPGLPNNFLTPNARSRLKVASLTVVDLVLDELLDNVGPSEKETVIPGWCGSTRPGISRFRARCFASPRNDVNLLPTGRTLHRRLAGRIGGPELHARAGIVGVD